MQWWIFFLFSLLAGGHPHHDGNDKKHPDEQIPDLPPSPIKHVMLPITSEEKLAKLTATFQQHCAAGA